MIGHFGVHLEDVTGKQTDQTGLRLDYCPKVPPRIKILEILHANSIVCPHKYAILESIADVEITLLKESDEVGHTQILINVSALITFDWLKV